jgi:4'-phosphopantetheinyl transferase
VSADSLPVPGPAEVHVWRVRLDPEPERLEALWATLSPDERARADRFHFSRDRNRFVAGRGQLRCLLGRYLLEDPGRVRLAYGPRGKPRLASEPAAARLSFNLSHSGAQALCAVAPGAAVGVDVESLRAWEDAASVAGRYFSASEAAALRRTAPGLRAAAFLTCWTRKEAFIKATGDGLSLPLHEFDVSVTGDAVLLRTAWDPDEAATWSLADLSGGLSGCIAALAIRGHGWRIRWRDWRLPR